MLINSNKTGNIRKGSILVLVFSILSWVGAAGGFIIGFLLGLIGAILGLTWKQKIPAPIENTESD